MSTHYDVLIIGSGQAGNPLGSAFAKAGLKTALAEAIHFGGTCVNDGCVPTKTIVGSARVAYLTRKAAHYGVGLPGGKEGEETDITISMDRVKQRKNALISAFSARNENTLTNDGVDILNGSAKFVDAKTVHITPRGDKGEEKTVTADKIIINTGERPIIPDLEGLDRSADFVLDSTAILDIGVVPTHLVVVGGGVIGLEFSQIFRRFGSKVTIVQRGKQLLPREDPEIAEALLKILEEDGIEILLQAKATSIKTLPDTGSTEPHPRFELSVQKGHDSTTSIVKGTHILFAAGRTANIDTLDVEAAGIHKTPRGHIQANSRLETNIPHIYAVGDVKGGPAFTHISYDDHRILRANLIDNPKAQKEGGPTKPDKSTHARALIIPSVTYTDPQLGHVGLHEAEARAKYPDLKIQTASMPMAYVARALETDEARGLMKAVVVADEPTGGEGPKAGQILGFTCLGIEGGEVMSVVQAAMMGGVTWMQLRDAVWAHPSLAESLNNVWGFLK